jgi:hypothetical protein
MVFLGREKAIYSIQNSTMNKNSMAAPSQNPALLAGFSLASHFGQNSLNSRTTFWHFLQITIAAPLTNFSLGLLGRTS